MHNRGETSKTSFYTKVEVDIGVTACPAYHKNLALATLAGLFLSACSGGAGIAAAGTSEAPAAPAAALESAPFFIPGETMTWDVTFAGIEGGRARLAVGQVGDEDGRRLVVLHADAESAGIAAMLAQTHDSVQSWIDVESGIPARTESATTGTGKPLVVHAERVAGEPVADVQIFSEKSGEKGIRKKTRLPTVRTHDPLSALLALRGWKAPRGGRVTVYSLGGTRVWRNVFTVEGREDVDGPLGRRAAIRIRGVATRITPVTLVDDNSKPPRTFTVWLTDDRERIPIRLTAHTELGDVVANATSYVPPE